MSNQIKVYIAGHGTRHREVETTPLSLGPGFPVSLSGGSGSVSEGYLDLYRKEAYGQRSGGRQARRRQLFNFGQPSAVREASPLSYLRVSLDDFKLQTSGEPKPDNLTKADGGTGNRPLPEIIGEAVDFVGEQGGTLVYVSPFSDAARSSPVNEGVFPDADIREIGTYSLGPIVFEFDSSSRVAAPKRRAFRHPHMTTHADVL